MNQKPPYIKESEIMFIFNIQNKENKHTKSKNKQYCVKYSRKFHDLFIAECKINDRQGNSGIQQKSQKQVEKEQPEIHLGSASGEIIRLKEMYERIVKKLFFKKSYPCQQKYQQSYLETSISSFYPFFHRE